jgi:hypothetical protein
VDKLNFVFSRQAFVLPRTPTGMKAFSLNSKKKKLQMDEAKHSRKLLFSAVIGDVG